MTGSALRYLCFIAVFLLPAMLFGARDLSLDRELVRTPEGNFYMWHRTPARADDLAMPILDKGTILESITYRVRDRKMRDLLFFSRVHQEFKQSAEEIARFYQEVLGADASKSTDTKTGVITMTAGNKEDFRLVVVTPRGGGTDLRLEHVQQFSIPPRVYTEAEQRAIRVLNDIAAHYQAAQRVRYTMEQCVVLPKDSQEKVPPTLTWQVDFRRPAQITVTAGIGKTIGVRITTEKDRLRVHPQVGEDTLRPFSERIAIDDLSELADDPAAHLMLGDALITDRTDFIDLDGVPGVPTHLQALITLTNPDDGETLRLIVDLRQKVILRSETVITHDGHSVTVTRTYKQLSLDSSVAIPAPATVPQSAPKSASPSAVPGP